MFVSAYGKIEKAVVGIGIRNDPEYRIFGTGFLVGSSGWIMTNRHVIEALLVPHEESGEVRMQRGAAAFLFVDAPAPEGLSAARGMAVTDLINAAIMPMPNSGGPDQKLEFRGLKPKAILSPEAPDIAVCQIDPTNLPPEISTLHGVNLVDSGQVQVGQTVGILGFPQGVDYPSEYVKLESMQMCPLLQTGVVAGMFPFSRTPKPTAFVLDIVVNPGSSGSPVFLPNGDVVGVVYATRQRFCELLEVDDNGEVHSNHDKGVHVVSGLGLAVPSVHLPKEWLGENSTD